MLGRHKMATLEYVGSGTSHTKILNSKLLAEPEVLGIVRDMFQYLDGLNGHRFSLLYNAFIEKHFGQKITDNYKDVIYNLHADSGGLQIITQGKKITPELKEKVYRVQARHSDIAMCFDEIPINMLRETSDRNDTSGRFFDRENMEHYARLTGQNIERQIQIFIEEKSTSKPMIIAQGNCYDTYMKWVEYILEEIPLEHQKYIGGIAMGAAALGTGILEDIERAAYATKLPFEMEHPHIHILGVGSLKRLMPYLSLVHSGYYPEDIAISYDSTTHTQGPTMGTYYKNGLVNIRGVKATSLLLEEIYDDMNKKFKIVDFGVTSGEHLYQMIRTPTTYFLDEEVVDIKNMRAYYCNHIGYIASSIANFTKDVNQCIQSEALLLNSAYKNKVQKEISSLLTIKDLEDFMYWMKKFGGETKSNRIESQKPSTLDSFFGD